MMHPHVTEGQRTVLIRLAGGPRPIGEVGAVVADRLEIAGLVRVDDPGPGQTLRVHITPAGHAVVAASLARAELAARLRAQDELVEQYARRAAER
jgi:hypothetical protein